MEVVIDGVKYVPEPRFPYQGGIGSFGQLLRQRRQEMRWSLENAAENIGISKTYLWELEQDQGDPSFRIIVGISIAYRIQLVDMASAFK